MKQSEVPHSADHVAGHRVFSAFRWTLAGTVLHRLINFAGLALIARLVSRDSFGVYRELLSLHLIMFVALPLGFDHLYTRERTRRSEYWPALKGALFLSTAFAGIMVVLLHRPLSSFLKLGDYSWLLYTFPFVLAVQGLKTALRTPLTAELNFRATSAAEVINTIVTTVCGISAVLAWPNPVSLYIAFGAGEIAECISLRAMSTRKPDTAVAISPRRLLIPFGTNWRFCLPFTLDQLLNAVGTGAPVLLLGSFLGHNIAGSYAMANSLVSMPLYLLVGALGRVVFPSLAGLSEEALHRRTLLTLMGSAAFVVPVIVTLGVLAPAVVHVILGKTWQNDTPLLVQMIASYGVLIALFSPISSLDVLRNRPGVGLAWNLAHTTARLLALYFASPLGLIPAAGAYCAVSLFFWFLYGHIQAWLLGAGFGRFYWSWGRFLPAWLALAGGLYVLRYFMQENLWFVLPLSIVPIGLYFVLVLLVFPQTQELIARGFPERLKERLVRSRPRQ
jgi:O-antigen/teichoic acid export membrane protein